MKTIIITFAIRLVLYGFTDYKSPKAQTVKAEGSVTTIAGAVLFQKGRANTDRLTLCQFLLKKHQIL